MKLYLDNCCYNRPYDDQSQAVISLEAQAKIKIQEEITTGKHVLVSSYVEIFENNQNPYESRRESISAFLEKNTSEYIGNNRVLQISEIANEVMESGIKEFDALHVACAIYANCDYLITTDKRLLKYSSDSIAVINPVDFIRLEGSDNE